MPHLPGRKIRLDMQQLRHAYALSVHRSFTRAAAAVRVSQPTLSRSVKSLEDQVGAQLFVRGRHGVEPTDFGHLFLEKSFEVIARLNDLEREVALQAGGPVTEIGVCVGPYVAPSIAMSAVARTVARYPTLRIRVVPGVWDTAAAQLRNRTCEFAVVETSLLKGQQEFKAFAFPPLRGYFVGRAAHPLAGQRSITLGQALSYPIAMGARLAPRLLDRFLTGRRLDAGAASADEQPFPAIECPDVHFALDVVERTDALTIAALDVIRDRLEAGRLVPLLHEPWLRSNFGIVQLRGRTLSPAGEALAQEFRKAHAEALQACHALHARWYRHKSTGARASKAPRKTR